MQYHVMRLIFLLAMINNLCAYLFLPWHRCEFRILDYGDFCLNSDAKQKKIVNSWMWINVNFLISFKLFDLIN